jgi:hypothetical protein
VRMGFCTAFHLRSRAALNSLTSPLVGDSLLHLLRSQGHRQNHCFASPLRLASIHKDSPSLPRSTTIRQTLAIPSVRGSLEPRVPQVCPRPTAVNHLAPLWALLLDLRLYLGRSYHLLLAAPSALLCSFDDPVSLVDSRKGSVFGEIDTLKASTVRLCQLLSVAPPPAAHERYVLFTLSFIFPYFRPKSTLVCATLYSLSLSIAAFCALVVAATIRLAPLKLPVYLVSKRLRGPGLYARTSRTIQETPTFQSISSW